MSQRAETKNCVKCRNKGEVINPETFVKTTCPACLGDCYSEPFEVNLDKEFVQKFIEDNGLVGVDTPSFKWSGKDKECVSERVVVPLEIVETKDQNAICRYIFAEIKKFGFKCIYSVSLGYANAYLVRGC